MKIYRVLIGREKMLYAEVNGSFYRLDGGDAIDVLRKYASSKTLDLGRRVDENNVDLSRGIIDGGRITTPFDPFEVWGAGITYHIARKRYSEEDVARIRDKTIYELVYEAARPELFLKDTGRRCVGYMEPISVRSDSQWTLPEPELGVVLDGSGEVLGYTVVNDVTARDIESLNPLYLPQAKTFIGCCSFGPCIVTPDEVPDPHSLNIEMKIIREDDVVYEGHTSTSRMIKRIPILIEYLTRDNNIPDGTLLMTGTGLVPGSDITLIQGDIVDIVIGGIGRLVNPVVKL